MSIYNIDFIEDRLIILKYNLTKHNTAQKLAGIWKCTAENALITLKKYQKLGLVSSYRIPIFNQRLYELTPTGLIFLSCALRRKQDTFIYNKYTTHCLDILTKGEPQCKK